MLIVISSIMQQEVAVYKTGRHVTDTCITSSHRQQPNPNHRLEKT